jgi:hypothetical protein
MHAAVRSPLCDGFVLEIIGSGWILVEVVRNAAHAEAAPPMQALPADQPLVWKLHPLLVRSASCQAAVSVIPADSKPACIGVQPLLLGPAQHELSRSRSTSRKKQ